LEGSRQPIRRQPMSNFLARCAAIGLVGGGFAVTGDLGWLAARGMRLINARTVPSEQAAAEQPVAPAPSPGAPFTPAAPPSPAMAAPPGPRAADPFRGPPAPLPAAPVAGDLRPPVGGPERIDLAGLRPGERVTVWIGRPAASGPQPCIAFDLVDPASGEALLVGRGMAPRRVSIGVAAGGPSRSIARGDTLLVTPSGPAHHATGAGEALGPVTAIAIGRR
ncbi:MAG: hypothetical protein ACKOYJ_01375, partial [Planctomycetia bacterium]